MSEENWHGKPTGYLYHRCRCEACKGWHRERQHTQRQRRYAARELVDGRLVHPTVEHGKRSSYSNWGCRCRPCCDAHTRSVAKQREARRSLTVRYTYEEAV